MGVRSTSHFFVLITGIAAVITGYAEANVCKSVKSISLPELTIEICEESDDPLFDFRAVVSCNSTKPIQSLPPNDPILRKANQTKGTDWTFESCAFSQNLSLHDFTTALGLNKTRSLILMSAGSLPSSQNLKDLLYDMNLIDMDINGMYLKELPEKFFENSKGLQSLDIMRTALKMIKRQDFEALANLSDLLLYNNAIGEFEEGAFDKTTKLSILSIYYEPLKSLHADIFYKLTDLIELEICGSLLTELPSQLLRSQNRSLIQVRMNHNEKLGKLPRDLFSNLNNLTFVELMDNNLTSLPSDLFAEVPSLKTLNLSVNKLKVLPENLLKKNSKLQELSVRQNRLESFPDEIFSHTNLSRVYLNDNNITRLPLDFITRIRNNLEVYLEDNQIKTLEFTKLEKYAQSLSSNKKVPKATLYLQNNPLDCTCDLLLFVKGKMHTKIYDLVQILISGDFKCKNPSLPQNRTIQETSLKDLRC